MKRLLTIAALVASGLLPGCAQAPKGVTIVSDFDLNRYLGTWYEIARLDHFFERGLVNVTAEYSLRDDGGVKVVNRGFDPKKAEWREAVGKAYLADKRSVGRLKVSFFWPFYAPYNIIALDREGYTYAMVCSGNTSYLWILSRTPTLESAIRDRLIAGAKDWGFDTNDLIFVTQQQRGH